MHVDGFRFDLAATLARQFHEVDRLSAFFDLIEQDPIVSQVKLIAEPWDLGDGGYQVGNFPPVWSEWNGKFRDTVRDFWRGEPATLPELAYRLTGSSDLYEADTRRPVASINFVTAHDGFTMLDLVSYNDKHNEANGEDNRDGESYNRSWNCGAEGPTDDPDALDLLERQRRNLLGTLLLAAQPRLRAWLDRRTAHGGTSDLWSLPTVGLATVYGGYFGAGLGVITLSVLGITLSDSLTRLNALKQAISLATNVAAAVFFVFSGKVVWPAAFVMFVGSLLGGSLGGRFAGQVKPALLRQIVVAIGLVVAVIYFVS
jgi:hypothetical protein